jgi:hypothetical protein
MKTMDRVISIDSRKLNASNFKTVSRCIMTSSYGTPNFLAPSLYTKNTQDWDEKCSFTENGSMKEEKFSKRKMKYKEMQRSIYNFLERPRGLLAAMYQLFV